jgi:hypothetical protein
LELTQPLRIRVFKQAGAPTLALEPIRPADLADLGGEAWRDDCLRAGYPDTPLAGAPMRVSPILANGSESVCAGLELSLSLPDGRTTRRRFPFSALRHVADRAGTSLLSAGSLRPGEAFYYELILGAGDPAAAPPAADGLVAKVTLKSKALAYLRVRLHELLARARPVALADAQTPPVFYTERSFAQAESCARRGADAGVESGGALLGSLAACRDTGEFFSIIQDVIEVQEAEETKFSLAFSSRSWLRLQALLQARQAAHPDRALRLLGQAHGHPFRPNDGKLCSECEKRPVCALTSAWASQDDQSWHRAVFARQPWALCHIFGQTARGEPVNQLFGLKDGRLCARGFYVLPDFPLD